MSEIEELNVNLNRKNAELHSSLEVQASNYKAQVLLREFVLLRVYPKGISFKQRRYFLSNAAISSFPSFPL
jgi:hypothetical protein